MASSIAYLEQELTTQLRPDGMIVAQPAPDLAPEQSLEVDQSLIQGELPVEQQQIVEEAGAEHTESQNDWIDFNAEESKQA